MKLSVITITKNSAGVLANCLKSVKGFASEIVVVDDFSTDNTMTIANQYADKIFQHKLTSFPSQRNWAAAKSTQNWLLFLDADERLTRENKEEIEKIVKSTSHTAFRFKRQNYFQAKKIRFGGFWPDYQTRLFKRSAFKGVKGATHENYQYSGSLGTLKHPVPHFPDRRIIPGLKKTLIWTPAEAQALFQAKHPKVTWWRLFKVILSEFCYRYFKTQGFRDGYLGFVEALTQAANKFFIYQQLWELQHQKQVQLKTDKLEKKLL